MLFQKISSRFNIADQEIEFTIFETPEYNWGIRSVPDDELDLNYRVEV